jgi:hypothetical protein
MLTFDEARRVAVNVAKLPELFGGMTRDSVMNQKQSLLLFAAAFGVAAATSQPAMAKVCKSKITEQSCHYEAPRRGNDAGLGAIKEQISEWSSSARQKYGLVYWNWNYAANRKTVFYPGWNKSKWCARVSANPCRTFRPILILWPHPGTAPIVPRP